MYYIRISSSTPPPRNLVHISPKVHSLPQLGSYFTESILPKCGYRSGVLWKMKIACLSKCRNLVHKSPKVHNVINGYRRQKETAKSLFFAVWSKFRKNIFFNRIHYTLQEKSSVHYAKCTYSLWDWFMRLIAQTFSKLERC